MAPAGGRGGGAGRAAGQTGGERARRRANGAQKLPGGATEGEGERGEDSINCVVRGSLCKPAAPGAADGASGCIKDRPHACLIT